jgi:hypothetical protein
VHDYDVVLLASNGKVSRYSKQGMLMWQTSTAASWQGPDERWGAEATVASVVSVPLNADVLSDRGEHAADILVAFGDRKIEILDPAGRLLRIALDLPSESSPVGGPALGDANNDGTTDIVITTRKGFVGISLHRGPTTKVFFALVMMLIGIMALVLVVNVTGVLDDEPMPRGGRGGAGKRRGGGLFGFGLNSLRRSTDD